MGDVAGETRFRDSADNRGIKEFLGVVDLMPAGDAGGVVVAAIALARRASVSSEIFA